MINFPQLDHDHSARQGGDLRDLSSATCYIDMGTCVNRYGPPPEVRDAIQTLDVQELRAHPYGAEERFLTAYASSLNIDRELLVAGRGISEFIRVLARLLCDDDVAVITPDYTDTIQSFPTHLGPTPNGAVDTPQHRLERVRDGMSNYSYVMLSNPNNPTGIYIDSQHLAEACQAHPDSTLIVDEAFIDFINPDARRSMIHTDAENLVVLRSPNKLFGIAGTRTGVMCTRNRKLRDRTRKNTLNWPLSYIDALVACAALEADEWADTTRKQLLTTARRMEGLMTARFPSLIADVPVHYRFVPTEDPDAVYRHFLAHGIVVRTFSDMERGRIAGVRITAPTETEFDGIGSVFA